MGEMLLKKNDIELIREARRLAVAFNRNQVEYYAGMHGSQHLIRMAVEMGVDPDRSTIPNRLCEKGHLETLVWLEAEMNFRFDQCFFTAIRRGQGPILEWLFKTYSVPLMKIMCATASNYGQLHVLQWLRAKGCPWDHWTVGAALERGHVEIANWAIENGCPTE